MIRFAAAAAASFLFAASAARADTPPQVVPSPAPAWLLQYTTSAGGARVRSTRYVSARADGTVTWQQLDVDTGIADSGPMHRCAGNAQLAGEDLRALEDAAAALREHRDAGAPEVSGRATVSIALITPREGRHGDVSKLEFDPSAAGTEPPLKRAAAILSRYRCPA